MAGIFRPITDNSETDAIVRKFLKDFACELGFQVEEARVETPFMEDNSIVISPKEVSQQV